MVKPPLRQPAPPPRESWWIAAQQLPREQFDATAAQRAREADAAISTQHVHRKPKEEV